MLKRLFISLIILSTLTSDASAFSAYIRSVGLSPECWLNQLEDRRIMPDAAANIYIVSSDEIIQSRTVRYRLDFVIPENIPVAMDFICLCSYEADTVKAKDRKAIFGSDPSPPVC